MSWDPVWEAIYASREWGRYPPEELIRFTARHFYGASDRRSVKLLELGCGAGANLWFLAREGFDVYGIDGSATALHKAGDYLRSEGLVADLKEGDVTELADSYPASHFGGVIEIGCLVCNRLPDVARILDHAHRVLEPGGRIFSMTLAVGTWGDGLGEELEPGTFVDVQEGPLAGKGLCHFFSREEIDELFGSRFAELQVDFVHRSCDGGRHTIKHWLVEGIKRD